ncbi:MAG: DNA polymerase III subunit delta' [Betaproteobacteria bacterium]|nr:DNA polymerase III subunit delta' [Betaproteobacteria bacterium]
MKYPWHDSAWEALLRKLDRLPQALLLYGPEGIGKLALAEHFVQLLLCEAPAPRSEPCGACHACRWFLAGHHPDVRFVEPEAIARQPAAAADEEGGAAPKTGKASTEIKIDQVRELADFLNVGSHRGARRVALVQPAEDMNLHAANALLKSLEEPAPGAAFVLVSHRPARLLPTIRSRCVAVPLPLPRRDAARDWLAAQGVKESERWLAFAGGAPLRALDYAQGEAGAARVLDALASGDADALRACGDREELEVLAEALQKAALDRAFAALAGRTKYATGAKPAGAARGGRWLAFAREMGRHRALARHPLNPRLFAAEMLAGFAAAGRE